MNTDFGQMREFVENCKRAVIVGHVNPDGDCLGSCTSLAHMFKNMGKVADVFIDDDIPENFNYLPDIDKISRPPDDLTGYDLLIIVDSSAEDRIGACSKFRDFVDKVIVVDHHLNNNLVADVVVVNSSRASVGEILFEFFVTYNIEITKEMAISLYTSVATDTGCFMHSNTTSFSHFVAGELIKRGISLETINYNNFKLYDRKIIPGFAYVLNHMQFELDGQVCFVCLPYHILKKYDLAGETHKFKKYASEASGVRVGVFLIEKTKGIYTVSLRSNGNINVGKLAEEFGGGGHKNAAGFTYSGLYKDVLKDLLARLEKIL